MEEMNKDTTNQPTVGTWDKLPTEETERKPKVTFDINVTKDLTFVSEPNEFSGDNGAYYIFDVIDHTDNNTEKVVMTSSWTLLKGLKLYTPLNKVRLLVTKKMNQGKQSFEVNKVSPPTEVASYQG